MFNDDSGDIIFTYPEVSGGRTHRFAFSSRTGDGRVVFMAGGGGLTLGEDDSDQVTEATQEARMFVVNPTRLPREWSRRPEIFRRCFLGAVRYLGGRIPDELQ